jgi:uncharacterized membrane protein
MQSPPLFENDAVVLGILFVVLLAIFRTAASKKPFWQKFYTIVPSVLLCYFVPGILNTLNVINGAQSELYYVSSRYLLPSSLILFTISIDLKEVLRLGSKAIIVFLSGTVGIILGGPIAFIIVNSFAPDILGGTGENAVWRGMTTIAGSWIGGGANQAAMKEVFEVGNTIFPAMLAVDIIVANVWTGILLYGSGRSVTIDRLFNADASAIDTVERKIREYQSSITRLPSMADTVTVLGVAFGFTGLSHFLANQIAPWIQLNAPYLARFSLTSSFFWIVVVATTAGLVLSFTRLRKLEGVGASRFASVMLYVLVASIGMQMDILAIFTNPGLFMLGAIWMTIHILVMLTVAKIIEAPFFFVAVGSQANVGGAASAPIVASAFSPSLAPVGVLLAVLGYAVGTYGAWLCGIILQFLAS